MVDEQSRRVDSEITKVVEELDKSYLRKMQGDMHRCAAKCYDNDGYSVHGVAECVKNCSSSMNKAQQYITDEIERVQNRLQRCVMECNDKTRDKMGPSPSQNEINKFTDEFEKCATCCVDNFCDSLPSLQKSMKNVIASINYDKQTH